MNFQIVLGWAAPPMKEQFPLLDEADADQFDLNNAAITRLSIQGLITRPQRDAAAKRLTKSVYAAVKKAASKLPRGFEPATARKEGA